MVLVSNRDELWDRPTCSARFWDSPNNRILGPYDLLRREHGTWIGVNRNGKVCVLLNISQDVNDLKIVKKVSRGLFPKQFLESSLGVNEWVDQVCKEYGDDLKETGGFHMFLADMNSKHNQPAILFSNKRPAKVFKEPTLSLSNNEIDGDHWKKVDIGEQVFGDIIKKADENNWDQEKFIQALFQGLSTDTFPRDEPISSDLLKNSIFIPPITMPDGSQYGTRTQTVYLVDHEGNARYIEKTLQDPLISEFKYKIVD